jgi:hypothetical protein
MLLLVSLVSSKPLQHRHAAGCDVNNMLQARINNNVNSVTIQGKLIHTRAGMIKDDGLSK